MGMMIILLLGNKVNLHFLYFCDEIMLEIMEKLKYVDLNFLIIPILFNLLTSHKGDF